ncbi:MAG: ABC transporter ATP-binding protein [Hyphomicrobiaceae bacterium]
MPKLSLKNINKFYGDVHAVKDVSLEVPAGQFVVLVGPSGCGKSTLLRSIAGLEEISDGEIVLGDRSIAGFAPRDRNIAMVFQSYALYPYLNVYENVAFGLRARKTPQSEIDRQVKWACELLDIGDYVKRYPRELSGGQRQRVAIGRAIVRDADLFLFDEPLSNLDAKLRDGMREELKRLHGQLGKTFIYVTHDQIEAMTLAQRIILLRDGEIEQAGPPLDLFERPANTYVAGFLGSPPMNFIDVKKTQGSLVLPDGQALPFEPASADGFVLKDGAYIWGVRPEHFSRSEQGTKTLRARLDVIQPTGSRSYGTFYLAATHVVAELEARVDEEDATDVELSVDMDRTVFFDKDTGEAAT